MNVLRFLAALAVGWILTGAFAEAHESRPLYVELTEQESGLFALTWRTPASVSAQNLPEVALEGCEAVSPVGTARGPGGPVSRRVYRCTEATSGSAIAIRYPGFNPSVSTLLRVNWRDGETRSVLASPSETTISLPEAETTGGVAGEYFVLGIEHIWSGYDHLLFVACLVLIAGTWRRVLITITGFTIAHSITLALAALQVVRVPIPPVEATIALSIVFLATELVRDRRSTLTWRYPIAVSATFGLLHGFGFASVLTEIGLPQTEIPTALLLFNVGVEAGQIAFVLALAAVILTAGWLLTHGISLGQAPGVTWQRLQRPVGFAVGTVASFWLVERIGGLWV